MATLYTQKTNNIRKTWFLMTGFLVSVIGVGYLVSWYFNNPSLVYIALGFALMMNVGSYWFSDKLVLRMTGAHPIDKADAPELYNVVENLAITAGLPMPKIFIIDDAAPNAFATGRNEKHATVAATRGLLQILNRSELEGVMAHELSHIQNKDMLVMTVAVVLAGFVAMLADFMSRAMFWGGDGENRNPLFLVFGFIGVILAPIAAKIIQLAISRRREYLADAGAALLTRYPEGLASALEKISGYGQPMQRVSHATAHLFISDPEGGDGHTTFGERVHNLFATHPPVADRIRILRETAK